jgi:diketogulonate reductase-like aldo/keto reductase
MLWNVSRGSASQWRGAGRKEQRTEELVTLALREGFLGIDTANQPLHYEEAAVGDALHALAVHRSRLWLQTKCVKSARRELHCA